MKKYSIIYVLGGALAVWLTASLWAQDSDPGAPPSNTPQAWEHLALEIQGDQVSGSRETAQKINRRGDQGWELVDVESFVRDGSATKIVCFFERPK